MGKAQHPPLDVLSALADGELGQNEALEARAHLAGCPVCSDELSSFARFDRLVAESTPHELEWQALTRALASLPSGVPSARTDERIAALTRQPAPQRPRLWPLGPSGIALRGAVAAAVVLAILVGLAPEGAAPEQARDPEAEVLVSGVQESVLYSKTNTLYLVQPAAGAVDALNATNYSLRTRIAVGGRPTALAISEKAGLLFVLDTSAKRLTEIDAKSNTVLGSSPVDVAGTPTAINVDRESGNIVVATVIDPVAPGPRGPRPTPGGPAAAGQVTVINGATKRIETTRSVDVAPRLVIPDPRGTQALLVSPEVTNVVDASYRTVLTLPGGVGAAFHPKGDWFAILSDDAGRSKLTFVGSRAPAPLHFDGVPAAITPLPGGGLGVLVGVGGKGLIFVLDEEGRTLGSVEIGAVGDLEYDERGDRFTVVSGGAIVSAAAPAAAVAASPSPEASAPARTRRPDEASPLPSEDASASPAASASPSEAPAASASPSPGPSTSPTPLRVIVAVPEEAVQVGDGVYRLALRGERSPVLTATSATHMWFIDEANGIGTLDLETGVVYRVAELPSDARVTAIGVGPDHLYALDAAQGRLFLLDLESEILRHHVLPAPGVSAMTVSSAGVVWMAVPGSSQLLGFTPLSRRLTAVDIGVDGIAALEADGSGRVWFSTSTALGYYDPDAERVTSVPWSGAAAHELLGGRRNTLWVATASGDVYSVRDGVTISLVRSLGVPVTALALDAQGKPWYLAPRTGGGSVLGPLLESTGDTTVPGPAIGLALNSRSRVWVADATGGFLLAVLEGR